MRRIVITIATGAALGALGACIDNPNSVGKLEASGGSFIQLGGRGGASEEGGSAGAPGSSGGAVGGGRQLVATCTVDGETLAVSVACVRNEDCAVVQQTSTVLFSSEPDPPCSISYFGIGSSESAALDAFKDHCRPIALCSPDQLRVLTQDGKSGPFSGSAPLAECQGGVCRSYLP